jgi:glycosyltransferase involved in cell wall biosynthesis
MEKKKILIVSRSFYPENSPRSLRATALVKEFARKGHGVTVLTVKNDAVHIPFENDYNVTINDTGPLRFSKIGTDSTFGPLRLLKRALRRLFLLFFEYPDIELMFRVNKALQNESGYDLLISIAVPYPIHWGVAMARNDKHRIADVWIADCGDPYYGLENDSFNALFYFSYIEKWFSRKADYITIPFEGARSAYFPEFHSKIKIIPQGLLFPEKADDILNTKSGICNTTQRGPFGRNLVGNAKNAKASNNEKTTFAYFGNIQSYLHYAVPFLEKLNTVDKDFRFIVYTRKRQLFERILNKETLKKCEVQDYVERQVLLEQLKDVDFLVHFPYQKGSQKSLKLIDYAYLGKPVLSYRNDESSDYILNDFMNHNFENRMPLEDYQKYRIENVSAQFLKLAGPDLQLAV